MDYWKSPDWSDFFTTILILCARWFKEENPTQLIRKRWRGFEQSDPAPKRPSDERHRRVAGSEPSLALRQLAEEAWAHVEVIVRRGWIGGVMRWAGWLTKWELPCVDALIHSWAGANEADSAQIFPLPHLSTIYYAPATPMLQMASLLPSHDALIQANWENILLVYPGPVTAALITPRQE